MKLLWAGVILFTCGWLLATELFCPAQPAAAAVCAAAAMMCMGLGAGRRSTPEDPAQRGSGRFISFAYVAGGVLASQWLFHLLYWRIAPFSQITAGSQALAGLLSALGAQASDAGETVSIQFLTAVVNLRPSLGRLGVYPLGLVLAGGGALLVIRSRRRSAPRIGGLVVILAIYGLVRAALLALLAGDFAAPWVFWNPPMMLLSILPLAPLLGWLLKEQAPPGDGADLPPMRPRRRWLGAGLAGVSAAAIVFACGFEPAGTRKAGRVLFNDLHSGPWEITSGEFGEQSYGETAIYNYVCLRQWLSQFYDVKVNAKERISDELLRDVDVLVLKTPTQEFLKSERDAVLRFVGNGGGLWLVGDHTNLFGMSTFINPIAADYGLRFRYDDTFDLTTGRPSLFEPPWLNRHPALGPMSQMEFQTTCTLAASPAVRPVIVGNMLGSEMVDYGHVNFFGNIQADAEDEFGAYVQMASVPAAPGRVLAFCDSTVFSNFSMFMPGISELAIGSVEYLNRRETGRTALKVLGVAGLLGCAAAGWLSRCWRRGSGWTLWTAGLCAGVCVGGLSASALNTRGYPQPEIRNTDRRVLVDQSICSFRLPTSLDYEVADPERCFDSFYLNLSRLGFYPRLTAALGAETPPASLRIFIQPTRMPDPAQLSELRRYVESGGRVLVMESSIYVSPATRKLLEALDLQVKDSDGGVVVEGGRRVEIPADRTPRTPSTVAVYEKALGSGKVMSIIGAEWFSRKYIGQVYGMPDPLEREFHNLQYYLIHRFQDTDNAARQQ